MSFERIERPLIEYRKPERIGEREVVLMWTDNPPSPCLSIYLGSLVAHAIGIRSSAERVQLFIGKGEDAGRVGIMNAGVGKGDFRCVAHNWGAHRVYLTSQASVEHFTFAPRTTIPASQIEIRGQMLIFAYSGIKA